MILAIIVDGQPVALPFGQDVIVADTAISYQSLLIMDEAGRAEWGIVSLAAPAPTLDQLKSAKNAAVTVRRETVFAAGFTPTAGPLAGHTLQVRNEADRINWLTSSVSYSAAVSAGHGAMPGATFRTMANETVVTTFAEAASIIIRDMAGWGQEIMARSWALKDLIDAAEDEAGLAAIDIDAGWP